MAGGLYNLGNAGTSSPAFANCAFQNNTAFNGGAMINDGASSGSSSPAITNCSFQGNTGSTVGGALYNYAPAPGTSSATLTNCILFGNGGANTISNNNGSASVRYSLFEPTVTGYTSVTGNITTNTLPFTSTTSTALACGSPAINTGDPATTSAVVGITDLAGLPRFVGGRIDMGVVEMQDEMFTIAPGNWNNPAVWNAGRIPQVGDRARLKHAVTLPASYVGVVTTLVYDPVGRLIYSAGGQLQFGQ